MKDYKYVLVVSQHHFSYIFESAYIGDLTEDEYKKQMKNFLNDIMSYKNNNWSGYMGDFEDKYISELKCRHNINDNGGDIYIFHCKTLKGVLFQALKYQKEMLRISKGYKKVDEKLSISNHHDEYIIRSMFDTYFKDEVK